MSERVNSFGSVISSVAFISLATIAINFDSPVQAEGACIEHPPQPVAEGTPPSVHHDYLACSSCHTKVTEVLLWSFRYDQTKGRKCWFLSDAYGRDVTEEHLRDALAATQTIWSRLSSMFDKLNLTRTAANVTSDARSNPTDPIPKRQANAANVNKTDNSVRINAEAHGMKQVSKVSLKPDEQGLYEEFLQWREAHEVIKRPDQPEEPDLYEEFLRWSRRDPLRSVQR
jgi:hypothetical protein